MQERRKLPRVYLAMYSRVFDRGTGRVLGYLADLNHIGAMVISDDAIPEGQHLHLRLDLPDPIFEQTHVDFEARVAWCKPDLDPAFQNLGFEFFDVTDEQKKLIDKIVETYEFKRNQPGYPTPPSVLK